MTLPTILLILAAFSIGATVIAIIIAFRSERESRSAIFPIVREEEAIRARRARLSVFMWAAVTALFLGGWLASLRLGLNSASVVAEQPGPAEQPAADAPAPVAFATETVTVIETSPTEAPAEVRQVSTEKAVVEPPTPLPSPSPTVIPTEAAVALVEPSPTALPTDTPLPPTATPTETPLPPTATATSTATPPPTDTPAPTATPTPAYAPVQIPTSAPRTPAPTGARMGPIQFTTEISPNNEALDVENEFPSGLEAIYAVFPYSGMRNGVDFKVVWYQNGTELWRDESQWQWGDQANFYSFIRDPEEGLYKLELHVNDSILATGLFEVK